VNAECICTADAGCAVRLVHTNEELMIARHTYALVFAGRTEASNMAPSQRPENPVAGGTPGATPGSAHPSEGGMS